MPAFAATVHKAQGKTLDNVIVDLATCRGCESPYVMLSRVKRWRGLFVLRDFPFQAITKKPSSFVRKEFNRLSFL
ncbi:hypothetical protein BKA70DRAFT_1122257, partial [Coprinopsis sp. MPI-PUGE-AT-0042]